MSNIFSEEGNLKLMDALKYQFPKVAFYRPTMSTINFQCSISKQKFQIELAVPIKDAANEKALQSKNFLRNNVRFDYENSLNFSLNLVEVYDLIINMDKILAGQYETSNDKYPNTLIFDHKTNNQLMFVNSVPDKSANNTPTLKLGVYNSQLKTSISYIFRSHHELQTFRNLLKHFYTDMPWLSIVGNSIIKVILMTTYIQNNNKEENTSNYQQKAKNTTTTTDRTQTADDDPFDNGDAMFDANGVFIGGNDPGSIPRKSTTPAASPTPKSPPIDDYFDSGSEELDFSKTETESNDDSDKVDIDPSELNFDF